MLYLSASAVVIHYEEALYQVYAPLPLNQIESHPWLAFVVMWFETDPAKYSASVVDMCYRKFV